MSPRQQRLQEAYRAREVADKRIRTLLGRDAENAIPATLMPAAEGPADPTWQDVAHANQRLLWEMTRTFNAVHVTHADPRPEIPDTLKAVV